MSLRVRRTVQFKRDVDRNFVRIGIEDMEAAIAFFPPSAVPRLESRYIRELDRIKHSKARASSVHGCGRFRTYLIFYQIKGDHVLLLRLVHSAQDYRRILESD